MNDKEQRVFGSVHPSDFFPERGQYFRVRFNATADRSYMGAIWLCIESDAYGALGRKVLDESHGRAMPEKLNKEKLFVLGDVTFYDCTKIWDSLIASDGEETEQEAVT